LVLLITVNNNTIHTGIDGKRDDFDFEIVNNPDLDTDVPRIKSYGVNVSQLAM
jgi:hypothetical protein